jgi:hypothetical protein
MGIFLGLPPGARTRLSYLMVSPEEVVTVLADLSTLVTDYDVSWTLSVKSNAYSTRLVIDLEVVLELLGSSPLKFSFVIDQCLGHLGSVVRNR